MWLISEYLNLISKRFLIIQQKILFIGTGILMIALNLVSIARADPLYIVAAENFYADIVSQIGGSHVQVKSILNNPDEDPHLFEASPQAARSVSDAKIIILNGISYDPWMEKLLNATSSASRKVINVGALVGRHSGDNPHIWYDPAYMKAAARAIFEALIAEDPANRADYEKNNTAFISSLNPLEDKISLMRTRYAGKAITASEPIFDYQATLIGLIVKDQKFALAIMNEAEPTASEVAGFENNLKNRQVKAMIFNAQAREPAVERLIGIAKANHIAVVAVTETEPPSTNYQNWMLAQLNALDRVLSEATP